MMPEIVDNNVFKIADCEIIILCSVYSIWFMKYVFSAEMWLVKTWSVEKQIVWKLIVMFYFP